MMVVVRHLQAEIDHLNKSMLHKTTTRHIQQQSTMVPQLPPPMSTTAIDQSTFKGPFRYKFLIISIAFRVNKNYRRYGGLATKLGFGYFENTHSHTPD